MKMVIQNILIIKKLKIFHAFTALLRNGNLKFTCIPIDWWNSP